MTKKVNLKIVMLVAVLAAITFIGINVFSIPMEGQGTVITLTGKGQPWAEKKVDGTIRYGCSGSGECKITIERKAE